MSTFQEYFFLLFLLLFALVRTLDALDARKKAILKLFSQGKLSGDAIYSILKNSFTFVIASAIFGVLLIAFGFQPNEFGDFFGGTLGPVFSFLSFVILVWSLHIQMRFQEKSESIQQAQLNQALQQKHDEFFYLLLDRWRESANSLNHIKYNSAKNIKSEGFDAIVAHWDELKIGANFPYPINYNKDPKDWLDSLDMAMSHARNHIASKSTFLFPYFSIFCRLLDYINENMKLDARTYLKIIRSYMHADEVFLIYVMSACVAFNEDRAIAMLNSYNFLDGIEQSLPREVLCAHIVTRHKNSDWFVGK